MSDCCAPRQNGRAYDIVVIGAGSAGFSASITAAEQGASVALIGHGQIGGTCVNVGCVPSKTMIRAAEALHGARAANRFHGLTAEARVTDWRQIVAQKDELVASLRQKKYVDLLPQYPNIDYIEGAARMSAGGVEVDGALVQARKVLIATGGRPKVPPIPGIDNTNYLTSTSLLELEVLPTSLIVIGGGYIGAELAQMMARMGVAVTLVYRSRLLPQAEPEIAHALTKAFAAEGITLLGGITYDACREADGGVELRVTDAGSRLVISAERLVLATGRAPNVEGLDLADAGINQNVHGAVSVDAQMRTSRQDVYAAGDVTHRDQFVYMAAYGAKLAARNALLGDTESYDNTAMPWVVFTDPQIAGVGLSEAKAKSAGYEVKISVVPLDRVPRALAARDTRGLIKLIADARTDRLLGGQIAAPEGADAIQTLALALKCGMTAKQLGETLFPYLTTVEGLKLAAQGFERDVARLSCCAG